MVIRHKRRSFMIARGRVQNGVIVLDDGVRLPEGQEVTVLARGTVAATSGHSVLDIPVVSLGKVLRPLDGDDDLLGEMLEDRPCCTDWTPASWWPSID